nr:restriction endonuclease subunit S [Thiorhodococcus minor]
MSVGCPDLPAPRGWIWTSLYDLSVLGTGHTPSRSESTYWNGEIPWIGIRDASKHHGSTISDTSQHVTPEGLANSAARLLPAGTVCLSRTASVGYVVQMARDMATSQDFVTWTCNEGLDPRFLMYALLAEGDDIRRFGKGSTHTTIYFPEVKAFHICLPPIKEQRRIVVKLDSLFERTRRAREELSQIPRLIEQYKKAILEAAFRGDLTEDWRRQNLGSTLSRPTSELPSDWTLCKLQDISDIQSGLALGKKRKEGEALTVVPYLRVANVQRGHLNLKEVKKVFATESEIKRLLLKKGDVLMNEGGDRDKLGRGWIWGEEVSPCIHQNHVFRVRLKIAGFPPKFLSYYANEFGQDYFFSEGKQTTNLASISKSKLSSLPVPIPSAQEAEEIVKKIEKALTWLGIVERKCQQAIHHLDHLDQANLAKAFRGELVPQDPNDEPASVLLERIRAARAEQPKPTRKRRGTSTKAGAAA